MEVSVVIPIYNSEKYILKCIQSVLDQTFTDYELILVNDGSTDNSLSIIKEFENKDQRIIIYNQENRGVSCARNSGLKLASGRYITFIDSDDYVEPDFLEQLVSKTEASVDFVFSGMRNIHAEIVKKKICQKDYYWDLDTEDDFIKFLYQPLQSSPCAKLYSNSIIQKNQLRFDLSLSCAEDRDFNMKFFNFIRKAVSLSYVGYNYRRDVDNSLTKKKNPNYFKYRCVHWRMRYEMCRERSFNSDLVNIKLAKDLFSLANDEIMKISSQQSSIKEAIKQCKQKMLYVDFSFLKQWNVFINAPKWQKYLILHQRYLSFILINKIYLHVKKKS